MGRRKKYDVFLSYARVDDEHGSVGGLADEMRRIFFQATDHKLKIFQDKDEIRASDMWRDRIEQALESSAILVPVISRAYLSSEWCRYEWNKFAAAERGLAREDWRHLIYPVRLNGLPRASEKSIAQQWLDDITARQSVDLEGTAPGSHHHTAQVRFLMEGIMTRLHQVNAGPAVSVPHSGVTHMDVFVGYVGEGDRFVELLARARQVTIVGMTNLTLATTLEKALEKKRLASGNKNDFWESLQIVFLSDDLLDSLNDELADFPDRNEALLKRRLASGFGLRNIRMLLEKVEFEHWKLYESRYQLPFAGTLFEMPPDGKRIVQLLVRRPQRRTQNQMYMEFSISPDEYLAGAFQDILQSSVQLQHIIPIGLPRENGVFRCTGRRFREQVLQDNSWQRGWLPVVLLVSWRERNGHPDLLMQLRTRGNSHRELNRLAHLTNYVMQDDFIAVGDGLAGQAGEFDLSDAVLHAAARRVAGEEIGKESAKDLTLTFEGHCKYYYPDKENLLFYVFSAALPPHLELMQHAEMRPVSLRALVAAREKQVLRAALAYRRGGHRKGAGAASAREILALNLHLHGCHDLAEGVAASEEKGVSADAVSRRLGQLRALTRQTRQLDGREVDLKGLGGLLFREFFTTFLPMYERLGLPGAAEEMSAVRGDSSRKAALRRLEALYTDEAVMRTLPTKLDI